MPRRRSRIEIVMDILEALAEEGPMPPTRLATYANLPYDRLAPILQSLEDKGLVEVREAGTNPKTRTATITRKGLDLLRELRRLKKVLLDFGLDIV